MNKNDIIYVAGHKGLVGSAITRILQRKRFNRILTSTHQDLDLTRQEMVEKFFNSQRPDYVFLSAARVGGILANSQYPAQFIYDNLAIALNVIHSCWQFKVKKLINLGTSCIYPKYAPQPLKEEYLLSGALEPTNEAYAIAKIAAIKLCTHYNKQYGTNFLSLMPTNLYGPNDNYDFNNSHLLPALVRKFYLGKLLRKKRLDLVRQDLARWNKGTDWASESDAVILAMLERHGIMPDRIVLWGTGEPYREFLHVDDLAEAAIFVMENFHAAQVGELINIGSGQDMKIIELAQKVARLVGYKGAIEFDPSKPDGTPRKLLDVSIIKGLGWMPRIQIDEGITQAVEWYKNTVNQGEAAAAL